MLPIMAVTSQKQGVKLVIFVIGDLLVALVAIGLTLLVSWDLARGAAAVNQAGAIDAYLPFDRRGEPVLLS